MIKYLIGFLLNLFNPAVSLFAIIDNRSKISRKARLYAGTKAYASVIDDYSYVGGNTTLLHAKIGKYCSIASNCHIGMAAHTIDELSTSPIFTEKYNGTGASWVDSNLENPLSPVVIVNDVWIGFGALIKGGVNIADGAVIGAGAVVTKDVPPYAVVGGVPARVIKYRFSVSEIQMHLKIKWWDIPENKLRNNITLFQSSPNFDEITKALHVDERNI